MDETEKYAQLAEHYRQAQEQAADREAGFRLRQLENSCRILANSYAVLDRSHRFQQKIGPPGK